MAVGEPAGDLVGVAVGPREQRQHAEVERPLLQLDVDRFGHPFLASMICLISPATCLCKVPGETWQRINRAAGTASGVPLHRSKNLAAARASRVRKPSQEAAPRGRGAYRAPEAFGMATIKRVGVIGAGQMGGGIAHVCALAGYDVLINDVAPERIDDSLKVIDHNMSRQVARGVVGELDKLEAFARIRRRRDPGRPRRRRPRHRGGHRGRGDQEGDLQGAEAAPEPERRCWPPTPPRSRSPGWPRPPTGPSTSSACTS